MEDITITLDTMQVEVLIGFLGDYLNGVPDHEEVLQSIYETLVKEMGY